MQIWGLSVLSQRGIGLGQKYRIKRNIEYNIPVDII